MTQDDVRVSDGVKKTDGQPDVPLVTLSLHHLPIECPHWPPLEGCATCCPHPDLEDAQVDQLAPDDDLDDDWSPLMVVACIAAGSLAMAALLYGAIFAVATIAGAR